jgi:hypothetical protein
VEKPFARYGSHVRGKSQHLPALLSFWLPGLGQLWRCEWLKGGALLLASLKSSQIFVDEAAKICSTSRSLPRLVLWLVAATAVWLWAVVDARRHLPHGSPRSD